MPHINLALTPTVKEPTTFVPDHGPIDAEILIVGEAPGSEEMQTKRPFCGPSGQKLATWLLRAGLDIRQARLTNVLQTMPKAPGGSIDKAIKNGVIDQQHIYEHYHRLHELANNMPNLKVIVPVGNYAARCFTEFGIVPWERKKSDRRPGITQIRGSLYQYNNIPVVPTIHPASVLRQAGLEKRCLIDWRRIAHIIANGAPPTPNYNFTINPDWFQVREWTNDALARKEPIACDIETWGGIIQMVGFATSATDAIVIPTMPKYWSDEALPFIWSCIRVILESPDIELIFQNGLYDCWWLDKFCKPTKYYWDTMGMHHALDPLDNHSLDYMSSIYLDHHVYWKEEAKHAEEILRIFDVEGVDAIYNYNGIDCCKTYELFEIFYDQLEDRNLLEFYFNHYARMHKPLLGMSLRGAPIDRDEMARLYIEHIERSKDCRDWASHLAKRPLFTFDKTKCERDMLQIYEERFINDFNPALWHYDQIINDMPENKHTKETLDRKWREINDKTISDAVLTDVLFKQWKAPKGAKTATGREQLDDVSLRQLQLKVKDRVRGLPHKDDILKMVDLVQNTRRHRKLASFCDTSRIDSDGRIRSEYRFVTRSGRLASRANPYGTGANLQNYDRTLKRLFKASPGRVILEVDLSQAEGRVVKALTGDPDQIALARRLPSEGDEHKENAAAIFSILERRDISPSEIASDDPRRQIGKRVVHAANYDMGKFRLVQVLLKEDIIITPYEAGVMLDAYRQRNPALREYHKMVRRRIMQDERLTTSWGREAVFYHIRKDLELYKFGYSFIPQSEIGDLTNQCGLIPLDDMLTKNNMESEVILQIHDSIVIDAVVDEVYTIMESLGKWLSAPRYYGQCFNLNVELSIPCEFAIGPTLATTHKWKALPTPNDVVEAVYEIRHNQQLTGGSISNGSYNQIEQQQSITVCR